MKRTLILAALLAASSAFAQQPQPSPAEQMEQANARLAVLARQRDDAHNKLVIVEAEAIRLSQRVAELEKLCGEACRVKAGGKK